MIYYNEFDPRKVAMLRQLMADNLIPQGDIDGRSIKDIQSGELARYTQCHFFAGIGGWAIALQLAGWPDDEGVWTGSCPCQPYSVAGRQKAQADERHLWPEWFRLIRECKPATVFGEQVENAITHGWLDDVYQGLEAESYAVGSSVLPACSVGSPTRRNRLWFVGDSVESTSQWNPRSIPGKEKEISLKGQLDGNNPERFEYASTGLLSLGDSGSQGLQRHGELGDISHQTGWQVKKRHCATTGWDDSTWTECADGKQRLIPTESVIQPLADGFQQRRWLLHSAGDAIVPEVAAMFVRAFMETKMEVKKDV